MKKLFCGALLIAGFSVPSFAGDQIPISFSGIITPVFSSTTANGGLRYAHLPSAGSGQKNCITDFEVSIASTHPGGGLAQIYPYKMAIVEGSPTTGTTIYQVTVTTVTGLSNQRVEENRTLETAFCGDFNKALNFVILAPSPNIDPNVSYQGYRRTNP